LRTVIIANGVLTESSFVQQAIRSAEMIIAANGGALHCRSLGLTPDVVIGDFDSLEPAQLAELKAAGVDIIPHSARKDHTDLELAMMYAVSSGAEEIFVLAALGNRWDQTLANLLLPAANEYKGVRISLIDGQQEINLVRAGETFAFYGQPEDTLSLIPLWGNAGGVTTQGLEYPLDKENLIFGSTRGISNVLTDSRAFVQLDEGLLVSVLIHKTTSENILKR
jgi:thiamine pyrophosphokinase